MALEMADGKCIFFLSPKKALGEARTASRYDKRGRGAGTGTLTPQRASFPAKTTFLREKSTHKPRRTAQQHDFEDALVAAAGPALSVLVPIPSLMPCASLVTSYTPLRMFS